MSASHSSSELRRVGQKEGRPRRRRLMEFLPEIRCPAPSSRPEGEEDGSDGEIELTLGLSPLGCRTRKLSAARLRIPPPVEAPKGAAFSVPDGGVTVEDRAARETRMLESRARERSAREAEENRGGRWWGKDRKGAAAVFAQAPYVAQVMYPYQAHQQVQYLPVPVANGFGVPYLMSCWAPTSMSAAAGACRMDNASQAVAAALGRVPIPVPAISACAGCVAQPLESPGSSSSGVSDHRSTSLLAVNASSSGSSDSIKSPSSHLTGKNAAVAQPRQQLGKCESASAPTPDTAASAGKSRLVSAVAPAMPEKAASPNKPCAAVPDVESKSRSGYGDAGAAAPAGLPSSRMPCVSTTGSGPNGRTVTGFLYKYDKSGVGIVCTCHGKSFSPAEFVRHAGGADVAHPMRHIVMVPSCEC